MSIADRVNAEIARDDIRRQALGDTSPIGPHCAACGDATCTMPDAHHTVTAFRPAHIPADQWDAMTDDERQAMREWETKMGRAPGVVPTGTFDSISGVTSSPLYGPRSTWARQIKSWYPSVNHVHVDSRRTVRATHPGSEAFTLGFVTEHTTRAKCLCFDPADAAITGHGHACPLYTER